MVADCVDDRGGTGRLRLDVGPTAGGQMPFISGHSIQQPGGDMGWDGGGGLLGKGGGEGEDD